MGNRKLLCGRCREELKKEIVDFQYLSFAFHTEVLRCPKCGQVFIDEDLVEGKMHETEMVMEDK